MTPKTADGRMRASDEAIGMSEPSHLGATRLAYDKVAVDDADLLRDELAAKPLDRALLAVFAELVQVADGRPVADLGCGPGRVAAHLKALGLRVRGIDLSPSMVAVARRRHPDIRFDEGSIADLDIEDGVLGGVVAWYSVIHTPPDQLSQLFTEFARVLGSGGQVLVAFQAGDECVHLERAYGHDISLDAYRLRPDRVADAMDEAGLEVHTRVLRDPDGAETTPQAYLLARKVAAGAAERPANPGATTGRRACGS